jgi:hypothetical protein
MLYCELDDAFNNKTYKFREPFGNNTNDSNHRSSTKNTNIFDNENNNDDNDYNISTLDMGKFASNNKITYDSDKKGQDSDWAPIDSDTELLPKKPKSTPKALAKSLPKSWNKDETIEIDSESEESRGETKSSKGNEFAGTALSKLIKSRKPTHRECIKLYYNPTTKSSYCFDTALKHITKCELCKKEISKKKSVKFDGDSEKKSKLEDKISCSSSLNSFINNLREIKKNKYSKEDFDSENENETLMELIKSTKKPLTKIKPIVNKARDVDYDDKLSSMQSQMELQSPPAIPITQPAPKTQEDNTQYQNMMIQNTIQKYFEDMEEKKELNDKLNKIYEILNLEIKKNEIIEKERGINQYKNNSSNSEYSGTFILIGISIVIILLIVDIVLRVKF